jgi:hypothetical protein
MRLDSNLLSPPPSSDIAIADGNAPRHTLGQFQQEWVKNLSDSGGAMVYRNFRFSFLSPI